MAQDKVFNRLQIMYGACIKLSDTAVLAHDDGVFRLFKVSGSGAKEVGSSAKLKLYPQDRLLVLDDKPIRLFNFDGDTIANKKYSSIYQIGYGVYRVKDASNHKFWIIDNAGNKLLDGPFMVIMVYSNGLGEAIVKDNSVWFTWQSLSTRVFNKIQFEGKSFVFKNGIAIPNSDSTAMNIFDTSLNHLGSTNNEIRHGDMKIELSNGITFETGRTALSLSFSALDTGWQSWSYILEHQTNIQS